MDKRLFHHLSAAPMPRWGLESKDPLCFGGCERKLLSLVNPTWVIASGVQWMEVEIQQERKRSSLTHVLVSGSVYEVTCVPLCHCT